MASSSAFPEFPDVVLSVHDHGKAQVRVLKVDRSTARHRIWECMVRIQIESDASASYTSDDNSLVIPTDTCKNTVYVVAKELNSLEPEEFGLALVDHFLRTYNPQQARAVTIFVEKTPWVAAQVTSSPGESTTTGHFHGFVRAGHEYPVCEVYGARDGTRTVQSGLRELIVLKTTKSGFTGYTKSSTTSLQPTNERVMSTNISADWGYSPNTKLDFAAALRTIRRVITDTVFGPPRKGVYSPSVQRTLYEVAHAVLQAVPEIDWIDISMPNLHYWLYPIEQYGLRNDNQIYYPTSQPFGLIHAKVSRNPVSRL